MSEVIARNRAEAEDGGLTKRRSGARYTETGEGSGASAARVFYRQRGEKVERCFAHLYETGAMRRTHLRRHPNILKRLLIHAAAFNLGLLMRGIAGGGTPKQLQERARTLLFALTLLRMFSFESSQSEIQLENWRAA